MHKVEANGADIPALGFGTWQLQGSQARRMVEAALEIGYRHIDTAQKYGNETEVGAALAASGLPRDQVFVTTKIWPDHAREGVLQQAARESLDRLRLDSVDLLLLHWPNAHVPLDETMAALVDCSERGWARTLGVSNFNAAMIEEARRLAGRPLATNQVEYHPFLAQRTLLDTCRRQGMALTAYCPLARGKVFGEPTLTRIGERHGKAPGQVALRWLIQQDSVVAIPRSSSVEHARSNFAIFNFVLSDLEMGEITRLGAPAGRIVEMAGLAPTWDAE